MLEIKITQGKELAAKYASNAVPKETKGIIRTLTLKLDRLVKMATVVKTGRLRASIAHKLTGDEGFVGTLVEYAPTVEYGIPGTELKARHMEGSVKVLGEGMFSYGLSQLSSTLSENEKTLAKGIEKRLV